MSRKNEDTVPTSTAQGENTLPLVVGVDLGGTQIRTAILRGSRLLSRVALLIGNDPAPDSVIPRMYDTIEQAANKAGITLDQVEGIGIGAPGPLNGRTGVVFAPPNLPGWHNIPLRDKLQEHFDLPTFLGNDANVAALAEYMFGVGRGSQEIVYLTISTGIGAGVITNGQMLEGISGTASEVGHITIDWQGSRCNCGNVGCFEHISSGTAIARRAQEMIAMGQGDDLLNFALSHRGTQSGNPELDKPRSGDTAISIPTTITAYTVAQAADAGIPLACEIIARAAEGLGVGLVNIIHIFNPEVIILGGGVTLIGSRLLDPALRIVRERTMQVPRDAVRIEMASLGPDVGLVGAGALIYYNKQIITG